MQPATADLEREADALCGVIEANATQLAEAPHDRAVRLPPATFELVRKDRNAVYRVRAQHTWYVKLSRSADRGAAAREQLGGKIITKVLGPLAEYAGSPVIRTSLSPCYALATAIAGPTLNRVAVTQIWDPRPSAIARLERDFAALGTLLGHLHRDAVVPADAPPATKRPLEALTKRLGRVKRPDAVVKAIAEWHAAGRTADGGTAFVHGHMRLDNVIRSTDGLGFVDFEHCGTGSVYQDLSRPVSQMLLTRALLAFPHRRVVRALDAYLASYRRVQSYDRALLSESVAFRIARYYIETLGARPLGPTMGGIPATRGRLARITLAALEGGIEAIAPDLAL